MVASLSFVVWTFWQNFLDFCKTFFTFDAKDAKVSFRTCITTLQIVYKKGQIENPTMSEMKKTRTILGKTSTTSWKSCSIGSKGFLSTRHSSNRLKQFPTTAFSDDGEDDDDSATSSSQKLSKYSSLVDDSFSIFLQSESLNFRFSFETFVNLKFVVLQLVVGL